MDMLNNSWKFESKKDDIYTLSFGKSKIFTSFKDGTNNFVEYDNPNIKEMYVFKLMVSNTLNTTDIKISLIKAIIQLCDANNITLYISHTDDNINNFINQHKDLDVSPIISKNDIYLLHVPLLKKHIHIPSNSYIDSQLEDFTSLYTGTEYFLDLAISKLIKKDKSYIDYYYLDKFFKTLLDQLQKENNASGKYFEEIQTLNNLIKKFTENKVYKFYKKL